MTDRHRLEWVGLLALVAAGGFAGSNLRYVVGRTEPGLGGTLAVNVAGSAALGFLLYGAIHTGRLSRRTRVALGSGVLSSFTTYSTFAVETATADPLIAVGYVVASYALGFSGVVVGRTLALRVGSRGAVAQGGDA